MDWNDYFNGEQKGFRSATLTYDNGELVEATIRRAGKRNESVKITDENRNEPWVQYLLKFTEGL